MTEKGARGGATLTHSSAPIRRLGAGLLLAALVWSAAQAVARLWAPRFLAAPDLAELAKVRRLVPGLAAAWTSTGNFWLARGEPQRAAGAFKVALRCFPFDGEGWLGLGDAEMRLGHVGAARRALRNVVALYPSYGGAQARAANLLLRLGDARAGAEALRVAVRLQPWREAAAYDLAWTLFADPEFILDHVVPRARLPSYLEAAMSRGRPDHARAAWRRLQGQGPVARERRLRYVDFLIAQGLFAEARVAWSEAYGPRRGGTVYDGEFEEDPTGAGFGWRVLSVDGAATELAAGRECRSGRCVRIRFSGTANVNYHHLQQVVPIDRPGRYRLSAWVRASELTSLSGPRLAVHGRGCSLGGYSRELRGDHAWHRRTVDFTVSSDCPAVVIGVERSSTNRFDRWIGGTLWVDSVKMERLGS